MTTDDLLKRMLTIFNSVESRVGNLGEQNYAHRGHQTFEGKPLTAIGQDVLEEIQDSIAYLTFLHIRIEKIMKGLDNDLSA